MKVCNKITLVCNNVTFVFYFQFFRQDYCRYKKHLLDNLEESNDIDSCQLACQMSNDCNFFTFSKEEEVCILHLVELDNRICDIIHGPPVPSIQSCLDAGKIPWAKSSSKYLKLL